MNYILRLLTVFIFCFTFPGPVSADGPVILKPWRIIRTKFTHIRYKSVRDLAAFHTAVRFGPPEWNKSGELIPLTPRDYESMAAVKTDAIFKQAQAILDMKKRFNPVKINLYASKSDLKSAFERIYNTECRFRAWYRFSNNTVYINVRDLHAGMLAHELAHAIIDHYLTVRPPSQTAEILARYVDSHLDRGFVQ